MENLYYSDFAYWVVKVTDKIQVILKSVRLMLKTASAAELHIYTKESGGRPADVYLYFDIYIS